MDSSNSSTPLIAFLMDCATSDGFLITDQTIRMVRVPGCDPCGARPGCNIPPLSMLLLV